MRKSRVNSRKRAERAFWVVFGPKSEKAPGGRFFLPWGGASIAFVWTSANADACLPQVFRAEARTHFQILEEYITKKDTTFSIRISTENLETIKQNAKKARMSQSDYVTACCLGKQVVIIDGLKEVLKELKSVGKNLNQLVALAHMGRVTVIDLESVLQVFAELREAVRMILERKRW